MNKDKDTATFVTDEPENTIIAAFGGTEGSLTTIAAAAHYWLAALDAYDAFGGFVHWEHSGYRVIVDATDAERTEARRAFERLAAVPS